MKKYKYFTPVESDEHYLYVNEIGRLFTKATGLTDENGKPPYGRLRSILDMLEKQRGEQPLYFNTRNGVKRVYRHAQEAIKIVFEDMLTERTLNQAVAV